MGNAHLYAKEPPEAPCLRGIFPAEETGQHKNKKDYIGDEGGENVELGLVCIRDRAGPSSPGRTDGGRG